MAGMTALLSSPPPPMALVCQFHPTLFTTLSAVPVSMYKQSKAILPELQRRPSIPTAVVRTKRAASRRLAACACFNPFGDQPIIKDALKEPVAFMGGVFAGFLRLDLNEDPLKEWIARTVEDSGMAAETEIDSEQAAGDGREDEPQEIEIE